MRFIIIVLIGFLAACNGSTTNVPYTDPQVTAKLDALTQALAAATHAQAEQSASLKKLTLIGKVHGITSDLRMQGEFRTEAVSQASFGPCSDMGVLLGRGDNTDSQDPLSAPIESFQQCTGYEYSVTVATNTVSVGPRIFWDGPNCTGNMYEWSSGGGSYNDQTLEGGVVFLSPVDGQTSLMVKSGQTPQPILIQSVFVTSNPACQSDIEVQNLYNVTPNNPAITGVPILSLGSFQLAAP